MASSAESGGGLDNYPDPNAIYHEVSPRLILGAKCLTAITGLMVLIAIIITLARGGHDNTNYLLTTNLVISTIIGAMTCWWYKKGDLPADKLWFLLVVAGVILFQCITVDIYAFHVVPRVVPAPTTITPNITVSAATIKLLNKLVTSPLP